VDARCGGVRKRVLDQTSNIITAEVTLESGDTQVAMCVFAGTMRYQRAGNGDGSHPGATSERGANRPVDTPPPAAAGAHRWRLSVLCPQSLSHERAPPAPIAHASGIAVLPDPPIRISPKSDPPRLIGALCSCLLAGCAVGPNFKRPAPPDVAAFTSPAVSATAAARESWRGRAALLSRHDISAEWWTLFIRPRSPKLIERSSRTSGPRGGAGGPVVAEGKCPRAARCLLSQRRGDLRRLPAAAVGQIAPTSTRTRSYNLFTPR